MLLLGWRCRMVAVGVGLASAACCAVASAQEVPTCGGQPATILGSPHKDTLVGTPGPDVIVGFGGKDTISGQGGDDIICPDQPDGGLPEAGNDVVDAGAGSDVILASPGADSLDGGGTSEEGFDVINGGSGSDRIYDAGGGNAYLDTGEGADEVSVSVTGEVDLEGGGHDHVTVVAGRDLNVDLGDGANRLTAAVGGNINASSEGPIRLDAGGFNELNFRGSPGDDTVRTHGVNYQGNVNLDLGEGDDLYEGDPGSANGNVNIDGGAGRDTIKVPESTSPAATAGQSSGSSNESATPFLIRVNLVTVAGGPGDDRIVGPPNRAVIASGDEGDDTLKGGAAGDILSGDEGEDRLQGGSEEDILSGGGGGDRLDGGEGADGYDGGPGNDILRARDGQEDLFFDCGAGQDKVVADPVEDQNVNRFGCAESRFSIDIGGSALTSILPPTSVATYTWTPGDPVAHEWLTSASGSHLRRRLALQSDLPVGVSDGSAPILEVDPTTAFQTIEGFGGAMTQAAASLLAEEPSRRRAKMVKALFSSSGADLNYVRVPMGASDLSTDPYDYDPLPPGQTSDYGLEHFTVAHDVEDVIPALQATLAANPDIKLMATPWSAPGWMKIGGQFIPDDCGGSAPFLRQDAYPVYARYFLRFLQAYRDRGLPIAMVSLQNEPHNCNTSYPTMLMKPADQAHLASELRPLLDANGFGSTGILGWDHNWSEKDPDTGEHVLAQFPREAVELAEGAISAVGYHCYDKNPVGPEAQSDFHESFPAVDVYFTECSGFLGNNNAAQNLVNEVRDDLIGPLNSWARTSLYWSLVQGSDGNPKLSTQGGCQDCRGMLAVDPETGGWTRSEDYYYWAQFSKFVKRGAERIASTPSPDQEIESTAFQNPDGSIVVVVLNPSSG